MSNYPWYARIWYRWVRALKNAWARFDRRPRITEVTPGVFLGGRLTPDRIIYLREHNVRAMVSLQEETLDPFENLEVHLWLPSPDGRPPSDEQLRFGARFLRLQKAENRPVYVHCHGGVGRAPTLCAVYLILSGFDPKEALYHIRRRRPHVSMNALQLEAVHRFARNQENGLSAKLKKGALLLALWGGVVGLIKGQNASVRDFEIPVSRASSLFVNLDYGYERAENTTLTNNTQVGVTYHQFYESLPFAHSTDVLGTWSRVLGTHGYLKTYNSDVSVRVKKYAWRTRDVFGSVAFHGAYQKGNAQPASDLSVGVGFGRFINATSLRKAVRIEDFFLAEGVTTQRLPKEALLAVAYLIEREREYRETYGSETYKKFWYEEIEEVVQASGMLAQETLGAAGVLRMEEVLFQESIGDRFYGFDLTLGAKYDLTLPEKNAPRPKPSGDLNLRYALPIRWDTQVEEHLRINTPFGDSFGKAFSLTSTTTYLYEITNRVDFRADYLLTAERQHQNAKVTLSHVVVPSFLFYIENEVRLLATLRLVKTYQEPWSKEFSLALAFKAL